jgi:purine-binding chemotaxis protein CheW
MTATLTTKKPSAAELQFATFHVGELLLGIDIHLVREINRNLSLTRVPHAAPAVQGVINLRGEVVTIIDLRAVLGLPPTAASHDRRNVIVQTDGEQIGLIVDRVADVVTTTTDQIDPKPENLRSLDVSFFQGVFKLDRGLLVILDVAETLNAVAPGGGRRPE